MFWKIVLQLSLQLKSIDWRGNHILGDRAPRTITDGDENVLERAINQGLFDPFCELYSMLGFYSKFFNVFTVFLILHDPHMHMYGYT